MSNSMINFVSKGVKNGMNHDIKHGRIFYVMGQ